MSVFASSKGSTALEFGLCLPVLMGTVLAGLDVSHYASAVQRVRAAAAETARLSMLDSAVSGCVAPAEALRARSPKVAAPLLRPATELCVTRSNVDGLTRVTVTVTEPVTLSLKGLPLLPRSVTETTSVTF